MNRVCTSRVGGAIFSAAVSFSLLLSFAAPAQAQQAGQWFIGAGAGWQHFDSKLDIDQGDIDLLFQPEDEGDSLNLRLGYYFNKRWFTTAEYSRVDADETELDNWFVSVNRLWQLSPAWSVSGGVLAGESRLDWQEAPIETLNRDRESEAFLWGVQTALSFKLGEDWRLQARYQFLAPEHTTRLRPTTGRGEYRQEEFHHFSVGVDFLF